ncbi:YkgJ family cysteine cluster protein [Candidatus Pacearchaeota archaeon]|nr:YkgJ family cysteine cluster protein [Candidatus Pacearchaeota archaeon]
MAKEFNCKECNAKCCRYVATEIDAPEDEKDYENILWYLIHKNVSVFIEGKEWYIQFSTPCNKLDKDWKCTIYEKRPKICKELSINSCEEYGHGKPHNFLFETEQDFIEYLRKKGIKIRDLD